MLEVFQSTSSREHDTALRGAKQIRRPKRFSGSETSFAFAHARQRSVYNAPYTMLRFMKVTLTDPGYTK